MTLQREQSHGSFIAMPAARRDNEGYLIKELQHLLRARIEARIRARGVSLSFPHSIVLISLSEEPGLSGAQLARRCSVTAQSINGLLLPLEAKGLIARTADPENARVLRCYLKPKGERLLQQCVREARTVFEQMLGDFSDRERREFRLLLRRCIHALSATASEASDAALNKTVVSFARKRRVRT